MKVMIKMIDVLDVLKDEPKFREHVRATFKFLKESVDAEFEDVLNWLNIVCSKGQMEERPLYMYSIPCNVRLFLNKYKFRDSFGGSIIDEVKGFIYLDRFSYEELFKEFQVKSFGVFDFLDLLRQDYDSTVQIFREILEENIP